MNSKTFTASALALAHLSAAVQVTQDAAEGRWFDDCHVGYFDGNDLVIDDHCDHPYGSLRLTNWEPDPTCPYADDDVEVCQKMFVAGRDIPEGYRAMSQQDVRNNWDACRNAMGAWDIISLVDGKVDGAGYGNHFANHHEVQCDAGRWTFVMTDNDCRNELVCVPEPQCPYRDETEVCQKFGGREHEIPDGYKIMSQQDVRDNWSACRSAMGAWDIISLLDGKVDGWGYGNNFQNNSEVVCGGWHWMFLMSDSQCEGTGKDC